MKKILSNQLILLLEVVLGVVICLILSACANKYAFLFYALVMFPIMVFIVHKLFKGIFSCTSQEVTKEPVSDLSSLGITPEEYLSLQPLFEKQRRKVSHWVSIYFNAVLVAFVYFCVFTLLAKYT